MRVRVRAEIDGKAADVVLDLPNRAARALLALGVGEVVDEAAKPAPAPVQTAAVTAPEKRGGAKS